MICLVSLEHATWMSDPEHRLEHLSYCMDVKLKIEDLTGQPCLVQRYTDVTRRQLRTLGIEALLISGNAAEWSHYSRAELAELYDLIRSGDWPILGLCGGHHLIAMAHGVEVAPMRRLHPDEPDVTNLSAPGYLKEWGFAPVDIVAADPIFSGLGKSPVFLEMHYCEVKAIPPGFRVLASSQACAVQAMVSLDRPVYGFQFHPEGYTERPHDRQSPLVNLVYPDGCPQAWTDGRELMANFFRLIGLPVPAGKAEGRRKGTE